MFGSQDFPTSARQMAAIAQEMEEQRQYDAQKDAAIFQTAKASVEQNKILLKQIETLKEQNNLLKEVYENEKIKGEENRKQSRHNKIFGWVSFVVGTVIGIGGILFGIFF